MFILTKVTKESFSIKLTDKANKFITAIQSLTGANPSFYYINILST